MPILKANTHCHTQRSDGKRGPEEMIRAYERLGYDVLFLTDHNWSDYSVKERDSGMILFTGSELSNDSDVGQHVTEVRYGGEKLRILNHPSRYRNTVREVERLAKRFDLHAVEVTEHGRLYPKYLKCDLPHVASDDAHNFRMVADAYIHIGGKKKPKAVLKAVKDGNIEPGGVQFERRFVKSVFPEAGGIG